MSEILIYKANECTAKLDEATEIVNAEIHRFVCYDCFILKILFLHMPRVRSSIRGHIDSLSFETYLSFEKDSIETMDFEKFKKF